jgi:hypothetical protein
MLSDKTANTPSIKAYIDNSSEYTGYTGTVLFERRLSTAVNTAGALVLFGFSASPASS